MREAAFIYYMCTIILLQQTLKTQAEKLQLPDTLSLAPESKRTSTSFSLHSETVRYDFSPL